MIDKGPHRLADRSVHVRPDLLAQERYEGVEEHERDFVRDHGLGEAVEVPWDDQRHYLAGLRIVTQPVECDELEVSPRSDEARHDDVVDRVLG
jgi:hypothetical protein